MYINKYYLHYCFLSVFSIISFLFPIVLYLYLFYSPAAYLGWGKGSCPKMVVIIFLPAVKNSLAATQRNVPLWLYY